MPIGLTDRLVALGTFPLLEDIYLLGGLRTVADSTERDAIDASSRKAGMFVWVEADLTLFRLDADLTTWVEFSGGSGSGGFDYVLDPNAGGDDGNVYVYLDSIVTAASTVQGRVRVEVVPGSILSLSGTYDLSNISFHSRTGEQVTITFQDTVVLEGLPYELENIQLQHNKSSGPLCTLAAPSKIELKGNSSLTVLSTYPFVDQNGFAVEVTLHGTSRLEGFGTTVPVFTTTSPTTFTLYCQTLDTTQTTPIADSADLTVKVVCSAPPYNLFYYLTNVFFQNTAALTTVLQSNLYTANAAPATSSEQIDIITGVGGLGGGASGQIFITTGDGSQGDGSSEAGPSGALTLKVGNAGLADLGVNPANAGAINITGGDGGGGGSAVPGGEGTTIQIFSGDGGEDGGAGGGSGGHLYLHSGEGAESVSSYGGTGGNFEIIAGQGGTGVSGAGNGGSITVISGSGGGEGETSGSGGTFTLTTGSGGTATAAGNAGGTGGFFNITLGDGGEGADGDGGDGGASTLTTGDGGPSNSSADEGGAGGDITILTGTGGQGGGQGGGIYISIGGGGIANASVPGGDAGGFVVNSSQGGLGSATEAGGNGGSIGFFVSHGGTDGGAGAGNGGPFAAQGGTGGQANGGSAGNGGGATLAGGNGGDGDASLPSGDGGSILLTPGGTGGNQGGGLGDQGVVYILPPSNNPQTPSELRFVDLDELYVGFRAPNSITTSTVYVLPLEDGDAAQVLTTDGSGGLSWESAGNFTGDFFESLSTNDTSPHTIYTYTDPMEEDRGCITIEATVQAIGKGGVHASFKFVATFTRGGSSIGEIDTTFLHVTRSDEAFGISFDINTEVIELQVTSATGEDVIWKATGRTIHVDGSFSGDA